ASYSGGRFLREYSVKNKPRSVGGCGVPPSGLALIGAATHRGRQDDGSDLYPESAQAPSVLGRTRVVARTFSAMPNCRGFLSIPPGRGSAGECRATANSVSRQVCGESLL